MFTCNITLLFCKFVNKPWSIQVLVCSYHHTSYSIADGGAMAGCLTQREGSILALGPVDERVVDKGLKESQQRFSPSPQDSQDVFTRYAKQALHVQVCGKASFIVQCTFQKRLFVNCFVLTSTPVNPRASEMFWVILKGTLSGTLRLLPFSKHTL